MIFSWSHRFGLLFVRWRARAVVLLVGLAGVLALVPGAARASGSETFTTTLTFPYTQLPSTAPYVGTTGATGPQGDTGTTGTDGATGPSGLAGTTGPNGVTGSTGATGTIGPNGPNGATGPSGPAGATGLAGATGATGSGFQFITSSGAAGPTLTQAGTYFVNVETFIAGAATTGNCTISWSEAVNGGVAGGTTSVGGAFIVLSGQTAPFSFSGMITVGGGSTVPAGAGLGLQCFNEAGPVTTSLTQWWSSVVGS
jgi:hypothetical protein